MCYIHKFKKLVHKKGTKKLKNNEMEIKKETKLHYANYVLLLSLKTVENMANLFVGYIYIYMIWILKLFHFNFLKIHIFFIL